MTSKEGGSWESEIERYFQRKCVPSSTQAPLTSQVLLQDEETRTSVVVVEDCLATGGIGRAIMQHIVHLVPAKVIHIRLEDTSSLEKVNGNVLRFDDNIAGWFDSIDGDLLLRILRGIEATIASENTIIAIDSLSALLQQSSFRQVAEFLRRLQANPSVGAIFGRFNTSLHEKHVALALRAQATAYLIVDTPASIASYHFLSKESKRVVPPNMLGRVAFCRNLNNGKPQEVIEYINAIKSDSESRLYLTKHESVESGAAKDLTTLDVSFNLSISDRDQQAKQKVALPYQHQGKTTDQAMFFIDQDDPDWDDDDLDDDLDI
ncbi:hypothetical protein AC1031_011477 [Aphanomyces cochlioides]|nr:hypothetical protein AC1031_011477 [Aphanomyces cochlioides]